MGSPRPSTRAPPGFTLVELVIVVAIIAVVGAIAVARFGAFARQSQIGTTRRLVHSVQNAIDEYHAYYDEWPNPINGSFFPGGKLPYHPMDPFDRRKIHYYPVDSDPIRTNPTEKRFQLTGPNDGYAPLWYHTGTGAFRARVSNEGTTAEQIALYNLLNNTDVTALSETGGPR